MMDKNETTSGVKIRVALFGCGKMGLQHLRAIQMQESAEIVAIADPEMDPTNLPPSVSDTIEIYSDPRELLEKAEPDVVHIVTPPATHTDLAVLALQHGANIYVEKPFTLAKSDAGKIF